MIHTNPHSRFVRPPCKELARQNGELLPATPNQRSTRITAIQDFLAAGYRSKTYAQFEIWAPVMGDKQTDARLKRICPTVFLCQRLKTCAHFENLGSREGMMDVQKHLRNDAFKVIGRENIKIIAV